MKETLELMDPMDIMDLMTYLIKNTASCHSLRDGHVYNIFTVVQELDTDSWMKLSSLLLSSFLQRALRVQYLF